MRVQRFLALLHATTVRQRSVASTFAMPELGLASATSMFTTHRPRVLQLLRAMPSVGRLLSTTVGGGVVMAGAAPVITGLTPKPYPPAPDALTMQNSCAPTSADWTVYVFCVEGPDTTNAP